MKRHSFALLTILVLLMVIGCGRKSEDLKTKITRLEQSFYEDPDFMLDGEGLVKARELKEAYLEYAEKNKDSADAPAYIFKAADLAMSLDQSQESLDLYNRIIFQYPGYAKAPECLFLVGFIYENYLQNYGMAKEIYESFLEKYPDHEFADDAALSIQNLGKSPEELIREFEEMNREEMDSTAVN